MSALSNPRTMRGCCSVVGFTPPFSRGSDWCIDTILALEESIGRVAERPDYAGPFFAFDHNSIAIPAKTPMSIRRKTETTPRSLAIYEFKITRFSHRGLLAGG